MLSDAMLFTNAADTTPTLMLISQSGDMVAFIQRYLGADSVVLITVYFGVAQGCGPSSLRSRKIVSDYPQLLIPAEMNSQPTRANAVPRKPSDRRIDIVSKECPDCVPRMSHLKRETATLTRTGNGAVSCLRRGFISAGMNNFG
uniref:Uncharacterized protein n=1 Tax=Trachysalambria curvirostris nimavirus TaxID=2984282 RepID=A0A9C7EZ15_9VIRU|nr:MAG: hypothetical protein [Trachysalambria curvirostris nimavirus]